MMSAQQAFQQHPLNVISHFLLIIGALNWLSFGIQHKDLVLPLVGSRYADYVYILVGIAGVFSAFHFAKWVLVQNTPAPASDKQ
jgi:uncharacterized membrane protein YuzA (DUF378 family)